MFCEPLVANELSSPKLRLWTYDLLPYQVRHHPSCAASVLTLSPHFRELIVRFKGQLEHCKGVFCPWATVRPFKRRSAQE